MKGRSDTQLKGNQTKRVQGLLIKTESVSYQKHLPCALYLPFVNFAIPNDSDKVHLTSMQPYSTGCVLRVVCFQRFDRLLCCRQLRYSGMMETIRYITCTSTLSTKF